MQVVILCGGRGKRMGNDETPKALFPIGGRPILWHIMKIYSYYGFSDFILCLGYKADKIRGYFKNTGRWKIKFVDTGLDTNTGGRIKKIEPLIKEETFFATYGDGLADIKLKNLLRFHNAHKKIATITVTRPYSPFGVVGVSSHTQAVTRFDEKPVLDHWINGGFFVFSREVFEYLKESDVLERDTFGRLVKAKQVYAYKHRGFWKCMDTYKDNLELNELYKNDKADWKVW